MLASHEEMERLWKLVYADELKAISTEKLALEKPDQSASVIITKQQMAAMLVILVAIAAGLFLIG